MTRPHLDSYAGDYETVGVTVKGPKGLEVDISVGASDKYGRPAVVVYGGIGTGYEASIPRWMGPAAKLPISGGKGTTYDVTEQTRYFLTWIGDPRSWLRSEY